MNNDVGVIALALILAVFLFGGDPDIADAIREIFVQKAGLK